MHNVLKREKALEVYEMVDIQVWMCFIFILALGSLWLQLKLHFLVNIQDYCLLRSACSHSLLFTNLPWNTLSASSAQILVQVYNVLSKKNLEMSWKSGHGLKKLSFVVVS